MKKKLIFLAFDYGTRNIGVAIGQPITSSATMLPQLVSKNFIPPWGKIDKLISSWNPSAIVIGVPYKLDGTSLRTTNLAKKFITKLKDRYHINVYSANEVLTTKEAKSIFFQQKEHNLLQIKSIDSLAAKLILEEWMSNINNINLC